MNAASGCAGSLRSVAVLSIVTVYVEPTPGRWIRTVTVSSVNVVFDHWNAFVVGPGSGVIEKAASTDPRFIGSEKRMITSWSSGTPPCPSAGGGGGGGG